MLTVLAHKATGGVVLVSLFLWLSYTIVLFQMGPYTALQQAIGEPMLEESFSYGAEEVSARLAKLTPDGRALYARFQVFDSWAAILMAMALTFGLGFVIRRWADAAGPLRYLMIVPLLLAASELVENLLLLLLISGRVSVEGPTAAIAGIVTAVKLSLAFAAVPFTVLALVGLGIRRLLGRARAGKPGGT